MKKYPVVEGYKKKLKLRTKKGECVRGVRVYMPPKLVYKYKQVSKLTKIPVSRLIVKASQKYLEEYLLVEYPDSKFVPLPDVEFFL